MISLWGWSDELRSWTWPGSEGRPLNVRVYSNGDTVKLFLNGAEVGAKPVSDATKLRAQFAVPYAPGELRAVAFLKGEAIARIAFRTAGAPARLRLKADRASIRRDRRDLSFVTAEVLDAAGNQVPDAVVPVSFTVSGAGELAGAGSANPKDMPSFRGGTVRTYHGKCLAVVRPLGRAGAIELRAHAEGLGGAVCVVQAT
jgi:beta-galactosidase